MDAIVLLMKPFTNDSYGIRSIYLLNQMAKRQIKSLGLLKQRAQGNTLTRKSSISENFLIGMKSMHF